MRDGQKGPSGPRGVRWLGVAVLAAAALAFVFVGASSADQGAGSYLVALDAPSVHAGSPITVTITNCATDTPGCSADSPVLGSANITIAGANLTPQGDVSATAPDGKTWNASVTDDTVALRAADGSELGPGQSVSVQISPTKTGAYTVGTEAREDTAFEGLTLANATVVADPSLEVAPGSLGQFLWTTEPNGSYVAGDPIGAAVTAYDTYGNVKTDYTGNSDKFSGLSDHSPSGCTTGGTPVTGGVEACPHVYASFIDGVAGGPDHPFKDYAVEPSPGVQLTITDPAVEPVPSGIFTVTPAPASHFHLSTPLAPITAGESFAISITALDPYGNTDTGYADGELHFTGPHSSPEPAPNGTGPDPSSTVVDFTEGQASTSIKLFDAETTKLTSTRDGVSGTTGSFTVEPASATHLKVPTPASQVAGVAFNETISALDAYGNKDTNYSGLKQPATFSGPLPAPNNIWQPDTPHSLSFAGGDASASVTLFRAETTTLTVTVDGLTGVTHDSFVVAPAAASHFRVPTPAQRIAGAAFNETITALDPYDNVDTNYVTGPIVFNGPNNSPPPINRAPSYPLSDVSFSSGQGTASITLYKAESTTLTATRGSISGTTPASFTVVPAAPTTLAFTKQPTETQVNSVINAAASLNGVQVEAKDAFGNLAYNTTVKIVIGANPGGGTLGGTTTQPTNASGVAIFNDLTISAVGIGKTLVATAPPTTSPTAGPTTSLAFIIAQTVTTCSGTCAGTATASDNTLNVSANGTVSGNTLGIALIGSVTQPANVCPGFHSAVGTVGSFVNVNFVGGGSTTPSLTITWTLSKALVQKLPDNGAAHYNICLGSVNLLHPSGSGTTGYPIKAPARCPSPGGPILTTACPVADTTFGVTFFWGILPDCPKGTPTGPCVVSRSKSSGGQLVFVYKVPYPWDPNGHLG